MIKSYFLLLFLAICIFSNCETNSTEQTPTMAIEEDAPKEWIHYSAKRSLNKGKKIVLISGDEEYRSEEALPQLAKILATHHGFDCTVLFAQDPEYPGIIDPNYGNNIPGLAALKEADLMVLFTRFRALPDEQMQHFQDYLIEGKPIFAIRTATHAFHFKDTLHNWSHWGNYSKKENSAWTGGFGRKVLGANWHTHHGQHKHQSTRGILAPEALTHPITKNIQNGAIWGPTDVYGVPLPLPSDVQPLLLGQVMNRAGNFDENDLFFGMKPSDQEVATTNPAVENSYNPNDPIMPIAWSKPYQLSGGKEGTAITSTIGASTDLLNEELRRLFVNTAYFLTDLPVPEKATVEIVGVYSPTQFNFHKDEYWDEKHLKIADLE